MHKLHWSTLFGNIFFMQDEERCWGSNRGTLQIPSQVWGHQTLFSYWWCLQGGHWDILCHGQRWHLWGSYTSWLYVQPSFLLNVTYNPEMLLSKNCIDYWQYVLFFFCLASTVKPLKIYQDLQDMTVLLGQSFKMNCEIFPGNVPGRWYRNGQLIQPNDRMNIIHRNKYVDTIKQQTVDGTFYQLINAMNLFFQDPPTGDCSQLSPWCWRLHFCAWRIFTEPLCQNSHHRY